MADITISDMSVDVNGGNTDVPSNNSQIGSYSVDATVTATNLPEAVFDFGEGDETLDFSYLINKIQWKNEYDADTTDETFLDNIKFRLKAEVVENNPLLNEYGALVGNINDMFTPAWAHTTGSTTDGAVRYDPMKKQQPSN